jgi:hypothetical protein
LNKEQVEKTLIDLSDSNPGCMLALSKLITTSNNGEYLWIDEKFVDLFKQNNITGSSIYILFNDKCKRDVDAFISLLKHALSSKENSSWVKNLSQDEMDKISITQKEWDIIEAKGKR